MTKPDPTPEGALIRAALTTRTHLSARKAAEAAGISEGRWRQIVSGYQVPTRGTYIEVIGPPETVAAMARVARVTPEELTEAGRDDAATVLRSTPDPAEEVEAPAWDGELEGPTTPLRDEEVLRWRTGETGRRYRLEVPTEDVNVEYTFSATETPEEVIEDLRDLLEPHRAAVRQLERRRARR